MKPVLSLLSLAYDPVCPTTFIERSANSVFRPGGWGGCQVAADVKVQRARWPPGQQRGRREDPGPLKDHGWIWQGAQGRVGV